MSHTKKSVAEAAQLSYDNEMSALRARLAGRPYAKDVHDMLPEVTKDHIRNVVNGKCNNPLVLAALKIVVHKLDYSEQRAQNRLSELATQLEQLEVAA
ncbi:MAG: hypothetical protein ACRYG7_41050 [Janthinobacterium lividum]